MSGDTTRENDELNDQPLPEAEDVQTPPAPDDEPQSQDAAAEGQAAQRGDAEAAAPEEELESLTIKLEQAEARAGEYLENLQRERASFQNYKRRVEAERVAQAERIRGDILTKLLPVLDDFYRATDAVPEEERTGWFEGVLLIQRKLERFLTEQGVVEIQAVGQPFDPNYHEAVGVDTESDAESDTVTEVLLRGYQHEQSGRVLRPAMVRVSQ